MKLMMVVAASVCAVSLSAKAADSSKPAELEEKPVEMENEESKLFSVGADVDFFSAYVWRNAVQNDEMVIQPCVWAEFTGIERFRIGGFIWQNYDLTDRRSAIYRYGLDETDYNLHIGYNIWASENRDQSFDIQLGHEWFTYHGVRDYVGDTFLRNEYPNARELYVKLTYENPIVNVYGQSSWMYGEFGDYKTAMHYELGFNKEIEVSDTVMVGADWNLNFGDHRYLDFLYGGVSNPYYDGGELCDDYDGAPGCGFGGTTVKIYASWQITEWMSLKGTLAYTGLLNGSLRESIGDQAGDYEFCYDADSDYARDLLWGGLSLNIEF